MFDDYTLALALEDTLPIIFSSIGYFYVARMIGAANRNAGELITVGWILLAMGGLTKVTFKIGMVLSNGQANIGWLDECLFWFLAPGFMNIAWGVFSGQQTMFHGTRPRLWLVPLTVTGLAYFMGVTTLFGDIESRTWFFVLLLVTTIGNIFAVARLSYQSRKMSHTLLSVLFIIYIFMVIGLQGAASAFEGQSIPVQWAEQLANTAAQGMFAYAAYKLVQHTATRMNDGRVALNG